jgi:translation initiation factor IF-3
VRIEDALRLAQEADLDLVEVAPNSKPPVAKIMDFGKFKYETAQKAKEARRHQANTILKEVRFRLKIDIHDYETKRKRAEGFLKAGDKVKAMILFRGREQSRPDQGVRLLQRFAEDVSEFGSVESTPMIDGRNMVMVIGPVKNKSEAKAEAEAKRAASKPQRAERPVEDAPPAPRMTAPEPRVEAPAPKVEAAPAAKMEAAVAPQAQAAPEVEPAPAPEATPAPKAEAAPAAAVEPVAKTEPAATPAPVAVRPAAAPKPGAAKPAGAPKPTPKAPAKPAPSPKAASADVTPPKPGAK